MGDSPEDKDKKVSEIIAKLSPTYLEVQEAQKKLQEAQARAQKINTAVLADTLHKTGIWTKEHKAGSLELEAFEYYSNQLAEKKDSVVTINEFDRVKKEFTSQQFQIPNAQYLECHTVACAFRHFNKLRKEGKTNPELEAALSMAVFGKPKFPKEPTEKASAEERKIYEDGMEKIIVFTLISGGEVMARPVKPEPKMAPEKLPQALLNDLNEDTRQLLAELTGKHHASASATKLPDSLMAALGTDFTIPTGVSLAEEPAAGSVTGIPHKAAKQPSRDDLKTLA